MENLRIEFDRNYGCNNRTGWSISIDGSFVVELERFLMVAIYKAIKTVLVCVGCKGDINLCQ